MGETRVDLYHLLEDLRDAYPGSLEETILTEIVANALDSGATTISLATDPAAATLTVVDNGGGMSRAELRRYHDLAASAKARGRGIGFAGVGIKLGLLTSEEVLTETRRGTSHLASTWRLANRHKAPWRWTDPPGLTAARGTAVRLKLTNPLSPLVDGRFVEQALASHFQPLLEPEFVSVLKAHYPDGVELRVNGERVVPRPAAGERAPVALRVGRQRRPSASGYLSRSIGQLPDDERGVGVSTLGKVIRRGWDWLGMTPASGERIGGLIEIPALAACLTLNKADFLRTGPRGAIYLGYRKALQEAVARQLALWGDGVPESLEPRRRRSPLERDLRTLLVDLAREFPLLSSLVNTRPGGQRRLPLGSGSAPGGVPAAVASVEAVETAEEAGPSPPSPVAEPPDRSEPPEPEIPPTQLPGSAGKGQRSPAHYGLELRFERRPDLPGLARLVESTVWVNEAHPAYQRAVASRSEGYHLAVAVAMGLAPLVVEPERCHAFVTAFLAHWGSGSGRRR